MYTVHDRLTRSSGTLKAWNPYKSRELPSHHINAPQKNSMGANLGVLHVCSISHDTMRQRKRRKSPMLERTVGAKCTASKQEPSCTCSQEELLLNARRQVHGDHARIAVQIWEFCTATETTATHEDNGTQAPKLQPAAGQPKKKL